MSKGKYSDMVTKADALGVNATGIECLAAAIFDQSARDMRRLRDAGKHMMVRDGGVISVDEIEAFFASKWCENLLVCTSWTPEEIRARI